MPPGKVIGAEQAAARRRDPTIALPGHYTFNDIMVYPTQELLRPPLTLFRGGPDWPNFWARRRIRHCRFEAAVPLDLRPWRTEGDFALTEDRGVWCGPVSQHFGHAIATFGSRIGAAARLRGDLPLVFSVKPDESPPAFFWEILQHFGADPSRVRLVRLPTIFGMLAVSSEAERAFAGAAPPYLDLLDGLAPAPPASGSGRIYVSRAGMWKGKIAGESYIEERFEAIGYRIFRPERFPLAEQLAIYRDAFEAVFADGSALHALQLLGRLSTRVTVIARDRRRQTARAALRARGVSPVYVDAVSGLLAGLGRTGLRQPSAGLAILQPERLLSALERRGIPLGRGWSTDQFLEHQRRDVQTWICARLLHPLHPGERRAIRRSLDRLGMDVDLNQ